MSSHTVTLYITCGSDAGVRVVRLEGWLEGEVVAELESVVNGGSGPLRLDLSELRSVDKAGLDALRALRAEAPRLSARHRTSGCSWNPETGGSGTPIQRTEDSMRRIAGLTGKPGEDTD